MQDLERIYNIAAELVTCAGEALALTDAGAPPRRGVVPGDVPLSLNCCASGGQLTVNVIRAYPSTSFPIADVTRRGNCDAPWEVVVYNVQVMRCLPVGDIDRPPSVDAYDKAAFIEFMDLAAVRNGIICCLQNEEQIIPIARGAYSWLLGDHLTILDGNCTGSSLQLSFGFPTCWEC